MKKYKWVCVLLAFSFIFLSLDVSGSKERGLKVVIKDQSGRDVGGYAGSHALLIGVSDYTSGWPDLESVPGEIDEMETILEDHGFDVHKVLNPNSEQMRDAVENFIHSYGFNRNDRLLIAFSGHGYNRLQGRKGYLVPADAPDPRTDEKGFLRKALDMTEILSWCRRMESRHVLFLFDSCFSGAIFKTRALSEIPPHISDLTSKPVRQFITAGSAGEKVPARSVFAPSIIRALRGEADINADGYVTGTELGMYLHDKVLGYQTGQTPQYGKIRDPDLDEGDFVFRLAAPGGKSKKASYRFLRFGGQKWEILNGKWRVQGDVLFGGPADQNHVYLQSPLEFKNFEVEYTVEYIKGNRNSAIGNAWSIAIIQGGAKRFRNKTSDIEGYGFNFSFNKFFNLFKGVKGRWYLIEPTWKKWQTSSLLSDKVHVKIVAKEGHFKIYANGVLITQFVDSQFPSGRYVLYVSSGLEVKFYDFKLRLHDPNE